MIKVLLDEVQIERLKKYAYAIASDEEEEICLAETNLCFAFYDLAQELIGHQKTPARKEFSVLVGGKSK